jgi:hypothetical protein
MLTLLTAAVRIGMVTYLDEVRVNIMLVAILGALRLEADSVAVGAEE